MNAPTPDGSTPAGDIVIAVDGTSGSGKSSTCRAVADRLGLRYLDTGAQYRAMTWAMLRAGVDVHDPEAVAAAAAAPAILSGTDPLDPTITVDGADASIAIRSDEVTAAVSPVSTVPAVRTRLVALQREIVANPGGRSGGIVVEGRDIGSVVCPDADIKVYLTADPSARARRRAAENGVGGDDDKVTATRELLLQRDEIDSGRAVAPLTMPDGAVHIDSTDLTLDEVIERVVGLVQDRA